MVKAVTMEVGRRVVLGGGWQRQIGDYSSSYYKGDRDNNDEDEKY